MKFKVRMLNGIPASSGIVRGRAVLLDRKKIEKYPKIRIPSSVLKDEIARFDRAVEASYVQIESARDKIGSKDALKKHAFILETHLMMLKDPVFLDRVKKLIKKEKINAEWALKTTLDEIENSLSQIENGYIKSRVADTSFVGDRLLRNLTGKEIGGFHLPEHSIVVAHDLSPADTAMISKEKVLGFATDIGGQTSHTAILARSLELPAVVGLKNASEAISPGDTLILDGISGVVVINPTESQITDYDHRAKSYLTFEHKLKEKAGKPAVTLDGHYVKVEGNLEFKEEVKTVIDHGAEGVGLYRTEFLYLNSKDIPTEEDHFEAYKTVVEAISPHTTVIRTLDLGGDKFYSAIGDLQGEMNPAMGLRAIRFCLKEIDIFKTQLRGLLRASHYGKAAVMIPMISGMEELLRAKEIFEETKEQLRKEGIPFDEEIPFGIMIEIPSAAIIADLLSKEVGFFSIGTNDLIQYSIAIDRRNEYVNYLYDPLHPGVLRLIKFVVDSAHNAGIHIAMCGEMAGEALYTPILLGFGIDALSTNAVAIPRVKEMIRRIDLKSCQEVAKHVLDVRTSAEIQKFLNEEIGNKFIKDLKIKS